MSEIEDAVNKVADRLEGDDLTNEQKVADMLAYLDELGLDSSELHAIARAEVTSLFEVVAGGVKPSVAFPALYAKGVIVGVTIASARKEKVDA